MITDNQLVVDLGKVLHAHLMYRNQHGNVRELKPKGMTVFNTAVEKGEYGHIKGEDNVWKRYPMSQIATSRGIIDKWTPVLYLRTTSGERLAYTGDKAKSIWKAWTAKQFSSVKQ